MGRIRQRAVMRYALQEPRTHLLAWHSSHLDTEGQSQSWDEIGNIQIPVPRITIKPQPSNQRNQSLDLKRYYNLSAASNNRISAEQPIKQQD